MRLAFICPVTRRPTDAGIESDLATLLRIRSYPVRGRCQACGHVHEWRVGEAKIGGNIGGTSAPPGRAPSSVPHAA